MLLRWPTQSTLGRKLRFWSAHEILERGGTAQDQGMRFIRHQLDDPSRAARASTGLIPLRNWLACILVAAAERCTEVDNEIQ